MNKKFISRTQIIAFGFFIIILIGTLLLMLPFSSKSGTSTSFSGALFTATSATCVTGLVVYDTFAHWSLFGQFVILLLIQIGGLGFITFGVFAMSLLKRKIGLADREFIHDSLNSMNVGGGEKLVRYVIKSTFICEGVGAILLSIRFIPQLGFFKGLYYGVFHSVSAFCNAGFDLMGYKEEFSSLTGYVYDPFVTIVIMLLIVIGGIGFVVQQDVIKHKLNFKRYMFHTKVVLSVTAILLIGSTVFFLISERNGVFANMSVGERILASTFAAVTPRTAGFNTVDIAAMSEPGKLVTILLMLIGGSPSSTAGGIKTTSIAVIVLFLLFYIKKEKNIHAFKRNISNDLVKKACTVLLINLSMALTAILVITLMQNLTIIDTSLEVFSAIGTVGMSTGITRDLTLISKYVLILLMYFGRIGSLSFALSFYEYKRVADIKYPSEELIIG